MNKNKDHIDNGVEGNFLLMTLEYPPFKGGVAHYYSNLTANWPESNIYVLTPGPNKEEESGHVLRRSLFKKTVWPRWLPTIWHLSSAIKNKRVEHILVGQVLPLGTVAYICSRWYNVRYSVFLHGTDTHYAFSQKRKKKLFLKILSKTHTIICANHYVRRIAEEQLPQEDKNKIRVVHPGLHIPNTDSPEKDKNDPREQYNLQDQFILFSIGRIIKRKGFDMVIDAMDDIVEKVPEVTYVLAGTGPEERALQKKIKNKPHHVQNRIIMLGSISEKEKWSWLRHCDAFIMPSREVKGDVEGFGIVYLEANWAGKPVIGGRKGGAADAIEEGVNGVLVDPESRKEISRAVLDLAQNPDRRGKLGEKGKERVEKEFNWKDQAQKLHKILSDQTL